MVERGYNRDTQQCRMKVKELRQAYQKTKEANGHSRSEPQTCCFYDQLHAILGGGRPYQYPTTVCGHLQGGGVSRNTEEDFVDEEVEEEENVQQASSESILPGSQDLFITLEPIPSQGEMPNPEAGEGTSDVNISMLLVSTPSLRLSQIRRRKNRTHNDMFSELMPSSCTDRAQPNAWRHLVAEARKTFSEHDQNMQEEMLRLMGEQMDMIRRLVELQER
nr:uncharacterized protein LOC125635726 [Caretta caretta]